MTPSEMSRDEFLDRFGAVYEDSPWVAEAVWPAAGRGELDGVDAMAGAMRAGVDGAPRETRLALIRAHPQLAVAGRMAEASVREQKGAGLDQCPAEELEAFRGLNAAYVERFGFPFIIAVTGLTRTDILEAFEARLGNGLEEEFATAIAQIHRIAGFRLASLFEAG